MEGEKCKELFSNEFLDTYSKTFTDVKKEILELTKKQESVISEIGEENTNLCNNTNLRELSEIHSVIRMYQHRLVALKKEMNTLQERSKNLKERAFRLKQNKNKFLSKNTQS